MAPAPRGGQSEVMHTTLSSAADPNTRFERDVLPLRQSLHRHALRLTRDHDDAEDLLQDTLLKAYTAFATFRPGSNLNAWLYRILLNTYINGYRNQQRRPKHYNSGELTEQQLSEMSLRVPAAVRSAEDQALDSFPSQDITAAMLALPDQFRMAVYYADIQGFRCDEIAELMQSPRGTVGSRLMRGRKRLRHLLADRAASCRHTEGRNR